MRELGIKMTRKCSIILCLVRGKLRKRFKTQLLRYQRLKYIIVLLFVQKKEKNNKMIIKSERR